MRKLRNLGITWFSKQASKHSCPNLLFRYAKSIFSNSLTTVFPCVDRKTYAMDLSTGNLSLTKNNKTKEIILK